MNKQSINSNKINKSILTNIPKRLFNFQEISFEHDQKKYKQNPFFCSNVITRPTPPLTKIWTNGVYNFNPNFNKNLPVADNTVHQLIKDFFTAKPLVYNHKGTIKTTRLVLRRLFRLSLNTILVSKPEIKQFNDKVIITVFMYNKKKNSLLEKLSKNVDLLDYTLNKSVNKLDSRDYTSINNIDLNKIIRIRKNTQEFLFEKFKWNTMIFSIWEDIEQLLAIKLNKKHLFKSSLNIKHKPLNVIVHNNKYLKSLDNTQNINLNVNTITNEEKLLKKNIKLKQKALKKMEYISFKPLNNTYFLKKRNANYNQLKKIQLLTSKNLIKKTNLKITHLKNNFNLSKNYTNITYKNNLTNIIRLKNLSILSNILNIASIKLINIPLKKKIALSSKIKTNKQKIFKLNFVPFKTQLNSLKSGNNKLISIYVKGRKLTNYEKNLVKQLILKTRKNNILKIINNLYLYKNNTDYFKKLIVNKNLNYKKQNTQIVNNINKKQNKYNYGSNMSKHLTLNKFKRVNIKNFKTTNKYKNVIKRNNNINFQQFKIIKNNIIILNKINKINKFINKYSLSSLNLQKLYYKNNLNFDIFKFNSVMDQVIYNYKFKYLKDILIKEITYINYIKMLSFNNMLYKSWVLMPLNNILSKIYSKKVIFNFINLKYIYLNSDILTQAIILKLKNIRKNSLHKVLRKVLNLVLISKVNIYAQDTFNPTYKYIKQHYDKYKYINNIIFKPSKQYTYGRKSDTKLNNILHPNLKVTHLKKNSTISLITDSIKQKKNNIFTPLKWLNHIQTSTINFIKYKSVFGLKLEAAGRLTKRSTASRAVFKFKFKGNLKNNFAITKDINPRIKSSNLIPNIQYSKLNSKTRNGSFGIKTWINNN